MISTVLLASGLLGSHSAEIRLDVALLLVCVPFILNSGCVASLLRLSRDFIAFGSNLSLPTLEG